MRTVLRNVLALAKLNYNACAYGDGEPVTLKFADAVGEILTAGPVSGAPLPFRLYILEARLLRHRARMDHNLELQRILETGVRVQIRSSGRPLPARVESVRQLLRRRFAGRTMIEPFTVNARSGRTDEYRSRR